MTDDGGWDTPKLTADEAYAIADSIAYRQQHFIEGLETSVVVVLLNAGDRYTPVSCVAGEWSGVKGDLARTGGIPKCPNGHVCLESSFGRKALGWVPDDIESPLALISEIERVLLPDEDGA